MVVILIKDYILKIAYVKIIMNKRGDSGEINKIFQQEMFDVLFFGIVLFMMYMPFWWFCIYIAYMSDIKISKYN